MSMRATSGISKAAKCTAAIATQFLLCTPGADNDTFSVASGSQSPLVGVFQSTTLNAGDSAEVMVSGISNVVLGGNVTRGQEVTSDANGNAIAAASYAPASGLHTAGIALESGVAGDIIAVLLEADHMQPVAIKANVALGDAAATLTAAQMIGSGMFQITPTAARALTSDTAANIVAGVPGAQVGSWFDFTIVCLAAFAVTLGGGAGVTVVGSGAVNNASGSFRGVITDATLGAEAVTIYRL
ncbi:MAG: hypothetical protein M0Z48_00580 [Nitrospiraceae bacterium]|nr:hypothetical protein [Nitrospiraceae bacterium]